MPGDVIFHGLKDNENYPDLKEIIIEIKQKFCFIEEFNVFIVDDYSFGPNLEANLKFVHLKQWDLKEYDVLNISRGILKKLKPDRDKDELKSFIAHEFSHIMNHDVEATNRIFLLHVFLTIMTSGLILGALLIAGLIDYFIFSLFWIPFGLILGFRNTNWKKRKMEVRCDADAVFITQNPEAFQRALKKMFIDFDKDTLENKNLWKTALSSIYFFIVGDDHPSNIERIQYIESLKNL